MVAYLLTNREEIEQAYRLRYKVFHEQLAWIPYNENKLDQDRYDDWSHIIGVSDNKYLLGCLRITPAPHPFMLENEFYPLVQGVHVVRKEPDTIELSRLAVFPSLEDRGLSSRIMKTLFDAAALWSGMNDIRYVYIVTGYRMLAMLPKKGWPFVQVGKTSQLPPSYAVSVAGLLDLQTL